MLNAHGRAMRVGDPRDFALLQAISRGEFATAGLRNRDLRYLLDPASRHAPAPHVRSCAAKISRQLRLLRAHGIIRKIPRSYRYTLTPIGHLVTAALFAARNATIKHLLADAA